MSIPRLPWFAFYPSDFVASTSDMSTATTGAYIRLLSYQWVNDVIPEDRASQARIAGGSAGVDFEAIERRLIRVPGGLAHPRLVSEKARSNSIAEKRRAHIRSVNERRGRGSKRDSDCDSDCNNDCTTTTTTVTDTHTTSPVGEGSGEGDWQSLVSEASLIRIGEREGADVHAIVSRQYNYLVKKLIGVHADDSLVIDSWRYACDLWARRGIRPSETVKKLTDNLTTARDKGVVIRHRIKQTQQDAPRSKI